MKKEAQIAPVPQAGAAEEVVESAGWVANTSMVVGATFIGAACRIGEQFGYAKDQPEYLAIPIKSGGHVPIGVIGAGVGLVAQKLSRGKNRLHGAVIGLATTAILDATVEEGQDIYFHAAKPFYAPEHRLENGRDLLAAVAGFGLMWVLNRRRQQKHLAQEDARHESSPTPALKALPEKT